MFFGLLADSYYASIAGLFRIYFCYLSELQERCARLFGMEASLLVPTGTMGNLIASRCCACCNFIYIIIYSLSFHACKRRNQHFFRATEIRSIVYRPFQVGSSELGSSILYCFVVTLYRVFTCPFWCIFVKFVDFYMCSM